MQNVISPDLSGQCLKSRILYHNFTCTVNQKKSSILDFCRMNRRSTVENILNSVEFGIKARIEKNILFEVNLKKYKDEIANLFDDCSEELEISIDEFLSFCVQYVQVAGFKIFTSESLIYPKGAEETNSSVMHSLPTNQFIAVSLDNWHSIQSLSQIQVPHLKIRIDFGNREFCLSKLIKAINSNIYIKKIALDVSNTSIQTNELHTLLLELFNISWLNIANNKLSSFKIRAISHKLADLHYLNLSGNNFSASFIERLSNKLSKLRYLNLNHNLIPEKSMLNILANLHNISTLLLDVGNINLEVVKFVVSNFPNLKQFGINGSISTTSIDYLMDNINRLEGLNISGGDLGINQSYILGEYADKLQSLSLNACNLDQYKLRQIFRRNLPITKLDISNNCLAHENLLHIFEQCRKLQYLDMSGTNLTVNQAGVLINKKSLINLRRLLLSNLELETFGKCAIINSKDNDYAKFLLGRQLQFNQEILLEHGKSYLQKELINTKLIIT